MKRFSFLSVAIYPYKSHLLCLNSENPVVRFCIVSRKSNNYSNNVFIIIGHVGQTLQTWMTSSNFRVRCLAFWRFSMFVWIRSGNWHCRKRSPKHRFKIGRKGRDIWETWYSASGNDYESKSYYPLFPPLKYPFKMCWFISIKFRFVEKYKAICDCMTLKGGRHKFKC